MWMRGNAWRGGTPVERPVERLVRGRTDKTINVFSFFAAVHVYSSLLLPKRLAVHTAM